jgi:hypothetical protein
MRSTILRAATRPVRRVTCGCSQKIRVATATFLTVWVISLLVGSRRLQADHIKINLGGQIDFVMEGRASNLDQAIITVTHEKFKKSQLYLPFRRTDNILYVKDVIKVPSRREQYNKQLAKAKKGDAAERMELAAWAIQHGMTDEFYKTVELVLETDPNHALATEVMAMRATLSQPLPESEEEEKPLRVLVGGGAWKFKRSPHYILYHDTPDSRAQERLDLLERVYETFFMWFKVKGRSLEKPTERLMVVLFNEYKNYLDFSVQLNPELKSATGYWSPETNIAVFFAHGTDPLFKELTNVTEELNKAKKEAERIKDPNRGNLVRFTDTIDLLRKIAQENEDIEVVSHEATHQVAGNSGLFPRRIHIPRWAQEGLAAFFESPKEATWSGVGAVNETRITFYRVLEKDRVHSDIDFIVSDFVYDLARSHAAKLHAYGQAWALTHFLMAKHFPEFIDYYRNLARLPCDLVIGEDVLKECFTAAFGKDRQTLDKEWRQYMNGLETDEEKMKKEFGDKVSSNN